MTPSIEAFSRRSSAHPDTQNTPGLPASMMEREPAEHSDRDAEPDGFGEIFFEYPGLVSAKSWLRSFIWIGALAMVERLALVSARFLGGFSGGIHGFIVIPLLGSLALLSACDDASPVRDEGVLAVVEDRSIDGETLRLVHAQLGAFGQARFRGPEGQRALLQSLVDLYLLDDQARRAGYEEDPRVQWAIVEELAARQARAVAERKVPRATVESDLPALRDWVYRHPEAFWQPEKRSIAFATFETWAEAESALHGLRTGAQSREDFKSFGVSMPMSQNDKEYPHLHRILFDPSLKIGDWLPEVVESPQHTIAARLENIQDPAPMSLEDPIVRARVVDAVLAEPQAQALEEYRASLRAKWPTQRGK